MTLEGPEELSLWFMHTLHKIRSAGWQYGIDLGNNTRRYTNMTNGGPVFVYVKDEKILRKPGNICLPTNQLGRSIKHRGWRDQAG